MAFRKFITSISLAASIAFLVSPTPIQASNNISELISESKSALAGTRTCLSEFDSKLEFPMSEKERAESQKQLNSFRAAFSISKAKPVSAKIINTKAQETLQTARQASKEAESGDRSKALKLFTQSRIKLFETGSYLNALQNIPSPTGSTKLTGRAQKEDQLKRPSLQSGNAAGANRISSTAININPNGISVDENDGVNRTQVDINPSGINVNEDGTRTNISINPSMAANNQTPISISPTGVRVGVPGGPSAVNIGASGIQVGSNGQSGNSGISIGADGINIGGLGQTVNDIVRGSMGAVVSSSDVATNGNTINIGGHDNIRTIRLNGQNLSITGHNNKIKVIGFARAVNVAGHDNVATLDAVNVISVTGHDNQVYFKRGPNGGHPQLNTLGRRNQISKIQ